MSLAMVHYEKSMRERAVREKKFLVTVSVNGRHLKAQSVTVQGPADLKTAQYLEKVAVALMKKRLRR